MANFDSEKGNLIWQDRTITLPVLVSALVYFLAGLASLYLNFYATVGPPYTPGILLQAGEAIPRTFTHPGFFLYTFFVAWLLGGYAVSWIISFYWRITNPKPIRIYENGLEMRRKNELSSPWLFFLAPLVHLYKFGKEVYSPYIFVSLKSVDYVVLENSRPRLAKIVCKDNARYSEIDEYIGFRRELGTVGILIKEGKID